MPSTGFRKATKCACRRCESTTGGEPGRPSGSLVELIERAVIFQDKHLLVIDKPAGVAVHGGSGMSFGVIEALRASRPRETLELVHRLDRDTSGCLLVARDRATLTALHALIRNGGMHKTYLALGGRQLAVGHQAHRRAAGDGQPPARRAARASRRLRQGLGQRVQAGAIFRSARDPDGSGHSDRAHASNSGPRLLRRPSAAWATTSTAIATRNAELKRHGLKRTFLHAQSVAFEWPGSGVPFHVSAPLPGELAAVLDAITPMKREAPKRPTRHDAAPGDSVLIAAFDVLASASKRQNVSRFLCDRPTGAGRDVLGLGQFESDAAQHRTQANQGQSDQRARIRAVDRFAQS